MELINLFNSKESARKYTAEQAIKNGLISKLNSKLKCLNFEVTNSKKRKFKFYLSYFIQLGIFLKEEDVDFEISQLKFYCEKFNYKESLSKLTNIGFDKGYANMLLYQSLFKRNVKCIKKLKAIKNKFNLKIYRY